METGERWRLGHRPALDGLRGLAVLLVLACHFGPSQVSAAGAVGVTVFFALSGFLITSLLLGERDRTGRIHLPGFYARRARRLLPALLTCVAGVAVGGLLIGRAFVNVPAIVGTLTYASDWLAAANLQLGALAHTWSLAIEEQFYLVWPLVLGVLASRWGRRAVLGVAAGGVVAAVLLRLLLWDGGDGFQRVYYGADTHADALLVGCWVAAYLTGRRVSIPRGWPLVAAAVALVPLCMVHAWAKWMLLPTVVPALAGVLLYVLAQTSGGVFTHRGLVWLGRRSYGLYLYHYPLVAAAELLLPGWAWWARAALVLPVALALTVLSWRYVEQPFLRRRQDKVCTVVPSHQPATVTGWIAEPSHQPPTVTVLSIPAAASQKVTVGPLGGGAAARLTRASARTADTTGMTVPAVPTSASA